MTTFSVAPHSAPLLPHAPAPAAPPWPAPFLLSACHSHPFLCLGSPCSGISTQLTVPSPGNLPWAPSLVQGSALGVPAPAPIPCWVPSLSVQRGHQIFIVCLFHQPASPSRAALRDPATTWPLPSLGCSCLTHGPQTRSWRLYVKDR